MNAHLFSVFFTRLFALAALLIFWQNTFAQDSKQELYDLIMKARLKEGLSPIPSSRALDEVALAHLVDLTNYQQRSGADCNLHSWSGEYKVEACCYAPDHSNAECMWDKPRQITNYKGNGYELVVGERGLSPNKALENWMSSPTHKGVLLNHASWSNMDWKAIGIAINSRYAVVWLGTEEDLSPTVAEQDKEDDAGAPKPQTSPAQDKDNTATTEQQSSTTEKSTEQQEKVRPKKAHKPFTVHLSLGAYNPPIAFNEYFKLAFSRDNMAYQGDLFMGFNLGYGRWEKPTPIGVFGTFGLSQPSYTDSFSTSWSGESMQAFAEFEAGFHFQRFLRISSGIGFMPMANDAIPMVRYQTVSVGIQVGFPRLRFRAMGTVLFNGDLPKAMFRPSLSILYMFS